MPVVPYSLSPAPPMNSLLWRWPPAEPRSCASEDCPSGLNTWPLHHVRHRGVLSRLCSSCLLLCYRNLYCCCCFLLLGPDPPAHFDDGDPLLAPPGPTATCQVCQEAVAHLSCLHSSYGVFVCPACSAARAGRPFSYAPSCSTPLDVRGARVVLLATRMSLALLRREAAEARAVGQRMSEESAAGLKQAHRALGMALGVDPELPSWNEGALPLQPTENPAPEGNEANMGMALDLNEPPPVGPEANVPGLLTPPPPLPAALKIGTGGVREMAMAAAEAAKASRTPRRTLQLFWNDKNPEGEEEKEM